MTERSKAQAVYKQTHQRLIQLLSADEATVRGNLANLRKGVGRVPGDLPKLWGILLSDLPEDMLGAYGKPSREEWAIYTALTLYALHQQGKDPKRESLLERGGNVSLGKAASMLASAQGDREENLERVARRFNQIALAADMPTLAYYLRGMVRILRAENIALDYPLLAKDLYLYQFEEGARAVRLQWGQDFYTVNAPKEKGKDA